MEKWQEKLQELKDKGLSLSIEKDGNVLHQSFDPMLKPLYNLLKNHGSDLRGATVYDKIVGRAAAYLCIVGGVREIYTLLASETAKIVLAEHHISITALKTIPVIMNRDNTDKCPMEKMALSSDGPESFLAMLEEKMRG